MSELPTRDLPRYFEPGTIIDDRYRVIELLGRGGVARVYRCLQLDIGREVALKVVSPEATRQTRRLCEQRLVNEALTTARLVHPNIVDIRALGREMTSRFHERVERHPNPYLVMECLRGHSLADHLAIEGPMRPERAIPLFVHVLDALALGHAQNIVHKDIKPDNLFLTYPGTLREALVLLDYGIARATEVFTLDGAMPCTVNYVAPEYIEHHIVSPAIDVYQAALVLVETLTGHPVVDSDYVTHCIAAHVQGRLELPDELMAGPLGGVLSRALARDYRQRLPDGGVFRDLLMQINPSHVHVEADDAMVFGAEDWGNDLHEHASDELPTDPALDTATLPPQPTTPNG